MEYQMRNWYYFNWLCGDHIVEQHIHNIDVSNWVRGMHPERGQRHGRPAGPHRQGIRPDLRSPRRRVHLCRRHEDVQPVPAHGRLRGVEVSEYAHGTKGTADIGGAAHRVAKSGDSGGAAPSRVDPYHQEHHDLFAALRRGEIYNEGDYGAESTMTAILGRMATYCGKIVTWDEAIASTLDLSPAEYSFSATPPVLPDSDGFYPVPIPGTTDVLNAPGSRTLLRTRRPPRR